jgi:hypothetical protein
MTASSLLDAKQIITTSVGKVNKQVKERERERERESTKEFVMTFDFG